MMDKLKQWLYYCIIGIISFVSLTFLPMIGTGTDVDLGWNIPNTAVGWIVWITVKLIVSILNVLLFYCFMQQAKLNIKDNEKYKKAREILQIQKDKEVLPKSPKKWNGEQYLKKGTTIFIVTALSTIALTQAILTFDYVSMLTYLFTILMGVVFGILQMKTAEEYWTNEYYEYALMKERENKESIEEEVNANIQREGIQESGRTSQEKYG